MINRLVQLSILSTLFVIAIGSILDDSVHATTIRLQFSGHLTTAGSYQQVSDTHIKCQVPAGTQGQLQLQATVSPSTKQVSITAVSMPSWASFSPTTAIGTATASCAFTPPTSAAGTTVQFVFHASVLGTSLAGNLTVTLDVTRTGLSEPVSYGPYTGVTDASGGFSILIPWMDDTVLAGTLTECTIQPLSNQAFSVTLVPKGDTIASLEDIGGFTFSVSGYAATTITQFSSFSIPGQTSYSLGDISLVAASPEIEVVTLAAVLDVPFRSMDTSDPIDGKIGDEWQDGSRSEIQLGDYPAVLRAQHDGRTIYVEIELLDPPATLQPDDLTFWVVFDNGDGQLFGDGDDQIRVPVSGGLLYDGIDYVGDLYGEAALDAQQDAVGCGTRSVDDGGVRYTIEISRPIDSGDYSSDVSLVPGTQSGFAFGFTGTSTPCGKTVEVYATLTLDVAEGAVDETSIYGPYAGVTDASGGISILIPWMGPPAYIVGALTECPDLLLTQTSVSVTMVPKSSGASISSAEDIGSVIVSSPGYEDITVDDLSYTSSIDLSGSTTATVNLGYFCVASVDSDQAPGDAEADQPDDICPTYSQIVDEMSDVDTRAYELHNQGTHTSDAAAASTLYQEALAADQLLLLRIGDLIALVGERAEPGALLKEAEAHQGDSVDLYALAYSLWAEANEVYAQGDHAYDEGDDVYDQGDDTYDQGDDAYDQGDEAYDEGDYDRYNALYDSGDALYDEGDALYEQGDAFYGQGDAFYGQGDALISKGNARVQQADELQEEVWRLLAEVRDLLCGQEAAEADAVS